MQQHSAGFVTTTLNTIPSASGEESPNSPRRTYDTRYVRSLFDRIASRYDLLNHILSSGVDIRWRRRAVDLLSRVTPQNVLDIATGTGDLAFESARLHPRRIIGIDVSNAMLALARIKAESRGLSRIVSFEEGEAEHLPFMDQSFDAATVAFGVRNFADLHAGLREAHRVLKPGGVFVVLEFSRPKAAFIKALYGFYTATILPSVGGFVSGSREAYAYLPSTIREFPDGEEFASILREAGFESVSVFPQTFGITTIYYATKRTHQ